MIQSSGLQGCWYGIGEYSWYYHTIQDLLSSDVPLDVWVQIIICVLFFIIIIFFPFFFSF